MHLESASSLLYESEPVRKWRARMCDKYERAAMRPWQWVPPDPPAPNQRWEQ
jgi:hypothetical protein